MGPFVCGKLAESICEWNRSRCSRWAVVGVEVEKGFGEGGKGEEWGQQAVHGR
jgi:hypothetical protein